MYKKQRPPIFLIALCVVCSIFALVCCTIAYVRMFKADRQLKDSQKTLAAQTEEMDTIKKELKKADGKEKEKLQKITSIPRGENLIFMKSILHTAWLSSVVSLPRQTPLPLYFCSAHSRIY